MREFLYKLFIWFIVINVALGELVYERYQDIIKFIKK